MIEQVGAESLRTYEQINAKIKRGDAVIVTADEFVAHTAENGLEASVQAGLETAEKMPHLRGALVVRGRYVGSVGRLPRLLNLKGEVDDMFKASLYDIGTREAVLL